MVGTKSNLTVSWYSAITSLITIKRRLINVWAFPSVRPRSRPSVVLSNHDTTTRESVATVKLRKPHRFTRLISRPTASNSATLMWRLSDFLRRHDASSNRVSFTWMTTPIGMELASAQTVTTPSGCTSQGPLTGYSLYARRNSSEASFWTSPHTGTSHTPSDPLRFKKLQPASYWVMPGESTTKREQASISLSTHAQVSLRVCTHWERQCVRACAHACDKLSFRKMNGNHWKCSHRTRAKTSCARCYQATRF